MSMLFLGGLISLGISVATLAAEKPNDQGTLDLSLRQAAMDGVIHHIEQLIQRLTGCQWVRKLDSPRA